MQRYPSPPRLCSYIVIEAINTTEENAKSNFSSGHHLSNLILRKEDDQCEPEQQHRFVRSVPADGTLTEKDSLRRSLFLAFCYEIPARGQWKERQ